MRIVCGLDIHRTQITFDWIDLRTGEEERGVVRSARPEFRSFLERFGRKRTAFALEGHHRLAVRRRGDPTGWHGGTSGRAS